MRVGQGHGCVSAGSLRPQGSEAGPGEDGPADAGGPAERLRRIVSGALADALLGAAAVDPSRDHQSRGDGSDGDDAPLERAVRSVQAENFQVVNADVTVFADTGLRDHVVGEGGAALRRSLAESLHVRPDQVSVKRADPEPFGGAGGRRIVATAVVLLDRVSDLDAVHAAARAGR